jgi:hypothetical protein
VEQLSARERDAADRAKRRDAQLSAAGTELERAKKELAEKANLAGALQSELDVKALEVEQLAASVSDLQAQLEEARQRHRRIEEDKEESQRRLEEAAAEQEVLRRNLRVREQELQDVVSANESSGVELYKLRRELEVASQSNEQLEEALRGNNGEPLIAVHELDDWPAEAVAEVQRLRAQLAAQARRHAEHVARIETTPTDLSRDSALDRAKAFRLEAQVRAEEQEVLLGLLEGAEQKIWEMNDASDRNAARLAASLAQLEKHKELLDEVGEELELNRKLLASAQARALEQERLLASERAKLARAGIGADGMPPGVQGRDLEDIFAELDRGSGLIELADVEAGAPQSVVTETTGSMSIDGRGDGPRLLVERIEDDAWPDDDEMAATPDPSPPAARRGPALKAVPGGGEAASAPGARSPAPGPAGTTPSGRPGDPADAPRPTGQASPSRGAAQPEGGD